MNILFTTAGLALNAFAATAFIQGDPTTGFQLFTAGIGCLLYGEVASLRRRLADKEKLMRDDFQGF